MTRSPIDLSLTAQKYNKNRELKKYLLVGKSLHRGAAGKVSFIRDQCQSPNLEEIMVVEIMSHLEISPKCPFKTLYLASRFGFWLVFMVFQGSFTEFLGSWFVFMGFHGIFTFFYGSWLVFMAFFKVFHGSWLSCCSR